MKSYLIIICLFFTLTSIAQEDSVKWKSEIKLVGGSLTTFLDIVKDGEQVTITSPQKADVRIFGGFKAKLGRLLGKSPKKGIFMTIKSNQKGDSLFGIAKIPVLGELGFKGILKEDLLRGDFIHKTKKVGSLNGVKTQENSLNYDYLYPKILEVTHKNIYSKKVFQLKEWQKFKKQLKNLCHNANDDFELFLGFRSLTPKLPFSHYYLVMSDESSETDTTETKRKTVIFEEKSHSTAYLKIKNFSTSQKELATIFPEIVKNKNYKNLIVDLRNNGGGGIEAAFEFAKYITNKPIEIGYFVTNKLQYTEFDAKLFETLPKAKPQTTEEFLETLKAGKGSKLIFDKPDNPIFSGNIYILTNQKTASTCEPLVYALKNLKMATIVGEKTAGAMLSGTFFQLSGKYYLFLPLADFYTYDGVRLEGIGVMPNIETKSEDALDKVLSLINEK